MKCLIVLPPTDMPDNVIVFPPGLGYIAAALKRSGQFEVFCLNLLFPVSDDPDAKLRACLEEVKPEVVLCGGLIINLKSIRNILRLTKDFNPNIVTVTGGAVVTGDPEPAMDCLQSADYGIIGEGEFTVVALCRSLACRPVSADKVEGLIIRHPGGYVLTPSRPQVKDLSTLPWCDVESFGFQDFAGSLAPNEYQAAALFYMSLSRGCPFNCTFCYRAHGRFYRQRNLDDFFAELRDKVDRFGLRSIELADDLLADSKPRLAEFCKRLKPFNFKIFTASLRVPQVDRETIDILQEAGCGSVFLGLESACNQILTSMKKGITIEQTEKALELLYEAKLSARGLFIFGDTQETMETAEETLTWWRNHPQYMITLTPMILYPGSDLYWKAVADGRIRDRREYLEQGLPWTNVSRLTDEEYQELMFQRLPACNAERSYEPWHQLEDQKVEKMDFTTWTRKISGICRYCGERVTIDLTGFIGIALRFPCPNCGAYYFSPRLFGRKAQVDKNLLRLLDKYGKIAFWGVGNIFHSLIDPESLDLPGLYLIDQKHGSLVGSKQVEPPEALAEHGVGFLITVPPDSASCQSIRRLARERYGIDLMIDLYQLQEELGEL